MNDQKLTTGLMALADSAPPVDVDVDAVILKSRQGVRRQQAVVLTAVATVAVLGGALAFGGPPAGTSPPASAPAASAPTSASAPVTSAPRSSTAGAGGLVPYPQLPTATVPVPNLDVDGKKVVFADLLKEKVPVAVPGAVTHEQTFGNLVDWDFTTNYVVVDGSESGAITLRVFGREAGKVMRQRPPGTCVDAATAVTITTATSEPVCHRQPDGSVVRVDRETEKDMEVPDALRDSRYGGSTGPSVRYRVAKHYRTDGTIVEVWGNAPTAFTDDQLIALATDPAFAL